MPVPNRSGVFDIRFSIAYDTKVGMIAPTPGINPSRKPTAVPRAIGNAESFRSFRVGRSERILVFKTLCDRDSALIRISPMPKTPITTGTIPNPSRSSIRPKVKRGAPMTRSIPTCAMSRPSTADRSARINERPASPVTSDRPTNIRAKNSGGPNLRAKRVRGRATSTSPMVVIVPPMKEPIAAMASADPARPCLAI